MSDGGQRTCCSAGMNVAGSIGLNGRFPLTGRFPWRGAVGVEPEDDAGVVGVVRLRAAELVIRLPRTERTVGQILQLPAPPLVADLDVELAVRAEEDLAGVVVAPHGLAGVRLERSQ